MTARLARKSAGSISHRTPITGKIGPKSRKDFWIHNRNELKEAMNITEEGFVQLLWFHFRQNNSGGEYIIDENMAENVFIQAVSAKDACRTAESVFDFSYCDCCGERWYLDYAAEGYPIPTAYQEIYEPIYNEARFHFFDGRVESASRDNPPFYMNTDLGIAND